MSETVTMTLTDFLLARIAEDIWRVDVVPDWHCTNSARGEGWGTRGECPLCGAYMFDGTEDVTEQAAWDHLESVHRRRLVLAECEGKRRIVERLSNVLSVDDPHVLEGLGDEGWELLAWETLGDLALPYANHPDYNTAWRT